MDYKQHSPGRTIALPAIVEHMLVQLARVLLKNSAYNLNARIFPMSQSAFSQAWLGVVERAGIDDLHFHDLRHEPASTFHKALRDPFEIKAMLGHRAKNVTEGYIVVDLLTIREKLDKFVYDGGLYDQYGWGMSVSEWKQFQAREGKETDFRTNLKEREGLTMEGFAQWHDQWEKEWEQEAQQRELLQKRREATFAKAKLIGDVVSRRFPAKDIPEDIVASRVVAPEKPIQHTIIRAQRSPNKRQRGATVTHNR